MAIARETRLLFLLVWVAAEARSQFKCCCRCLNLKGVFLAIVVVVASSNGTSTNFSQRLPNSYRLSGSFSFFMLLVNLHQCCAFFCSRKATKVL